METILDHPWELGAILFVLLALALELGRRVAARSRLHEDQNRKDQMATIRDGLFLLVSLLLGFTLALASLATPNAVSYLSKKLSQLAPLIFAPARSLRLIANTRSVSCANMPMPGWILAMRGSIAHAWAKQQIAQSGSRLNFGATRKPSLKLTELPSLPYTSSP